MLDSLFDRKTARKFDRIAKDKAKIQQREFEAVADFMHRNSKGTIIDILDIVREKGHPNEQIESDKLRNKYMNEELEFDDVMSLDKLFKSNYRFFENKGEK